MTETKTETEADKMKQDRTGRNFLFGLLGFFAVLITVNTIFVYSALSTHRGTVVENPYEVGLHFNDVIKEAQRRKVEKQSDIHEQ
jgi:nitrogen fixation protein FixH